LCRFDEIETAPWIFAELLFAFGWPVPSQPGQG
jgi:hypothetical protein